LLYIGGHAGKGLNILNSFPEQNRQFYWHWQVAKCLRQLFKRHEAYDEYENAIRDSPSDSVWKIIHENVYYMSFGY
jgi:hypothetical protein